MEASPWTLSHRAHAPAREMADRHYSRQKPGTPQFVPPGRNIVLLGPKALWVTSWPFAEYVRHAWAGAFVCSIFRNEGGPIRSSDLIRHALACTRWKWPDMPDLGMVTFVDTSKVRPKKDPGYCYLCAGFKRVGKTKGGLAALQILPEDFPEPLAPQGTQEDLFR